MHRWLVVPLSFLLPLHAVEAAALPRVRLDTGFGPIIVEVDIRRAPITARNFIVYAQEQRFDRTSFYRAARAKSDPRRGLVQGGQDHNIRRTRLPIAHEPTSRTGLTHTDGVISMARNAPGSAMGDFFICVGDATYLDAKGDKPGYAAFGRVVSGMPLVRRILAAPTHAGGEKGFKGQWIIKPIPIRTVRRLP